MKRLAACVVLAGCNSLLGNRDFAGPDPVPTCGDRGLPQTTLSGTVFAPNGTLPIYNALVYLPAGPLDDIPDGPSGPTCASGSPAVTAFSDTHGQFKLEGVPVGVDIPLVIQVGKWRRAVTVPPVAECTVAVVDASLTHLPRDRSEGHIPRIAITTGRSDTLECFARDLGIAEAEITSGAASTGRVRLYAGTGAKEFDDGALLERSEALLNATAIPRHDAILLGCDGVPSTPSPTAIQAMFDFTGRGGLLWLTHDGFPWLEQGPPPWNALATFSTDSTIATGTTVLVDQSSPHGQAFADWSVAAGASAMPGKLQLQYARSSCQTADPALTRQVLILDPASGIDGVQMFTWDSAMGGRVVFSDVHLSGSLVGGQGDTYPDDCPVAVSAQETAMMLEMFDTPTCVN